MQGNSLLSQSAVKEYQEIYKKVYGEDISQDEAKEQSIKLLRLFKLIYSPIKKEWVKGLK